MRELLCGVAHLVTRRCRYRDNVLCILPHGFCPEYELEWLRTVYCMPGKVECTGPSISSLGICIHLSMSGTAHFYPSCKSLTHPTFFRRLPQRLAPNFSTAIRSFVSCTASRIRQLYCCSECSVTAVAHYYNELHTATGCRRFGRSLVIKCADLCT